MNMQNRFHTDGDGMVLETLVIGHRDDWKAHDAEINASNCYFVDFSNLTRELFDKLRPSVVISNLFETGYDALDIAAELKRMGYEGRYVVVTNALPNPDMVRREVAQIAPALMFDVLCSEAPDPTIH